MFNIFRQNSFALRRKANTLNKVTTNKVTTNKVTTNKVTTRWILYCILLYISIYCILMTNGCVPYESKPRHKIQVHKLVFDDNSNEDISMIY